MTVDVFELDLVIKAAQSDSEALEMLFVRYLPMIRRTLSLYYIRSFDTDDWYQEARLVCYQTCLVFDDKLGSRFGNFYKLRFNNHVRSLIRKELAKKRRVDHESVSLDEKLTAGECINETSFAGFEAHINLMGDFTDFLEMLSTFEFQALCVLLGETDSAIICSQFDCTTTQLKSAVDRCRNKFKCYLQRGL